MTAVEQLNRQPRLTRNQRRLVGMCAVGNMLEFWDNYLIAFVLAFVIRPWNLSFGVTSSILLASGVGAIIGGLVWGDFADRYGRKAAFAATTLVFSFASLALAFTPEGSWVWLAAFRALLGFGTAGFFAAVALVQEAVPAEVRGRAAGFVSAITSAGLLLGAVCGAFVVPAVGWRGMFVIGSLPAFYAILIWRVVPESPRWAAVHGKMELARKSLAWVLERPATEAELGRLATGVEERPNYRDLARYPRSLWTGILVNLGFITGYFGFVLWSPTLLTQVQGFSPAGASQVMIGFTSCGIMARLLMSVLIDRFGRKRCGGFGALLAAVMLLVAAFTARGEILPANLFWLPLLLAFIVADGTFVVIGVYTGEIWPSRLRGVGAGISFTAGSVGKITGPLGLGLVAGSSNLILPQATVNAVIPAFSYLAAWFLLVSATFLFVGMETNKRTLEDIESALDAGAGVSPPAIAGALRK